MIPSIYQENIYRFFNYEEGNAVISAVAGSGKTTTILELLKSIKLHQTALYAAFNKSIVEELEGKFPKRRGIDVKTFHGLGIKYIGSSYPGIKIDPNKFFKFSKPFESYMRKSHGSKNLPTVMFEFRDMINSLRNCAINVPFKTGLSTNKIQKILNEITDIKNYSFDFEFIGYEEDYITAIKILYEMNKNHDSVDFNDMIYLPVIDDLVKSKIKPYDFVFVDEAQDLNMTQQYFLDLLVKKHTGRFIAVGDESQAIYGFAGADNASFQKLSSKPNTKKLPLSISYRCCKNVIKYVKAFMPDIESFEQNIDGIVRVGDVSEIASKDMALARRNKTLLTTYFELIKNQKKCYIKGKDIGEMLIKTIEKSDASDLLQFNSYCVKELSTIKDKLVEKTGRPDLDSKKLKKFSEYAAIDEKFECINILYDHFKKDLKSFQDLKTKIEEIFKDNSTGIMLSTVHKAKGLENDKVFILDSYDFPIEFAKDDWEIIQEQNLFYVACTRAKKELVFINESLNRLVYLNLLFKNYSELKRLFVKNSLIFEDYYFFDDIENYKFDFLDEFNNQVKYPLYLKTLNKDQEGKYVKIKLKTKKVK